MIDSEDIEGELEGKGIVLLVGVKDPVVDGLEGEGIGLLVIVVVNVEVELDRLEGELEDNRLLVGVISPVEIVEVI